MSKISSRLVYKFSSADSKFFAYLRLTHLSHLNATSYNVCYVKLMGKITWFVR